MTPISLLYVDALLGRPFHLFGERILSKHINRSIVDHNTVGSSLKINRRLALSSIACVLVPYGSSLSLGADSDAAVLSGMATDASNDRFVRVKSVLELKGTIQFKPSKESLETASTATSIESKTTLEFEEAIRLQRDSLNRFAVQLYSQAESVNDVQKYLTTIKLREECRTVVKLIDSQSRSPNCLDNPLTASERDLVQGPVSTIFLDVLLPNASSQIGDQWRIKGEPLARLLNLAKVASGAIKVTLVATDKKSGQLEFSGDVDGEVHDVKTTIHIEGKATFDRSQGLISWVAVTLQEKRQVGDMEPGFDITARVRILRESIDGLSQEINLTQLEKQAQEDRASELTRVHSKLGAYQFVADRGWTLYTDSGVDASLRWIQKNYTFAQCTITNLTDTASGEQLSIAGYQDDIQRSMGKQLGQMLEANERNTNMGLRMMRVTSIGTLNQVPMQWIHILVSNDSGRHLSMVFSMTAASADRFGSQDLQIADTIEFTLRELPKSVREPSKEAGEITPETASLVNSPTAKK